jgi:hypothetical protein
VTSIALDPGDANCPEGGTEFSSVSGTSYACNGRIGEDGDPGVNGQPWTPDNTLPPGATLTGGWAMGDGNAGTAFFQNFVDTAISFPIRLPAALDEAHVEAKAVGYVGTPADNCPGTAEDPQAKPGYLCVYTGAAVDAASSPATVDTVTNLSGTAAGASVSGAHLRIFATSANTRMRGSFAVTAPVP